MMKMLNKIKDILLKIIVAIIYFPAMWLIGMAIIGFSINCYGVGRKCNLLANRYLGFINRKFKLV